MKYKNGEEFLNSLYNNMHMEDVVMHTAEKSDSPTEKISKYLERLERAHDIAKDNPHKMEILKQFYYDKYVIKELPESYINLQKKIARERGYGDVPVTDEMKEKLLSTVQKEQEKSLDMWIDYLTSDDAMYPIWFKHYAFRGMLKLNKFDKEKGEFGRRSKTTTEPYVELNREVLARVYDTLVKEIGTDEEISEEASKALENGDTAVIDFEGFENGVAFEGGKGENYNLVIGSNTFIPGFEDQLVGKKAGEEVEVNVTFPETYHAENLAGKPVVFNVKVNDVKVKEVPALDDEFAKDTTEFETLAELRADVKAKLEEQAKNAADAEMRNALVEKVSANTEVEVPEAMIQHQIDNMLMELNYQLQYQGLNLQQLLEMTGRGVEELREERRADAERLVKSSLILEAIAEKENVEVNEADVDAELEKMAAMYNMEVEKIKSSLRETDIEDIKGQIKIRKTIDLLVENATIA